MAEAALKVLLSADGTQLTKTLADLEKDLKDFRAVTQKAADIATIEKFNAKIKQTEQQIKALKNLKNPLEPVTAGSNRAAQALGDLSRVAQDAPYGFMAIQNNLNPLLESFQRLKAETGSGKLALKELASSLAGPVGVGLALSVVSTLAMKFGDDIAKAFQSVDKEAERLQNVFSGAESGFAKAASSVNELALNIDLAKKGFLDKQDVVRQYNETIGKTTGAVKSLDEAERELTRNGDAYVKMMLYKAVANQALEEAAKKAFEAEKVRVRQLSQFSKATDGVAYTTLTSAPGALPANLISQSAKIGEAARAAAQKRRKKEAIDSAEKEANELLGIAKKFQADAAKISADFDFDFFGFTDPKKKEARIKKVKEEVFDLMKYIKKMMLDVDYSFVPFMPEKVGTDYAKAFLDQLRDEYTKANTDPSLNPIDLLRSERLGDLIKQSSAIGRKVGQVFGSGVETTIGVMFADKAARMLKEGFNQQSIDEALSGMADRLGFLAQILGSLQGGFTQMFSSIISGGKNAFQVLGDAIKNMVAQLIASLLAMAAISAILAVLFPGGAGFGKAFMGNFKGGFSRMFKVPGLAKGGIVPSGYEGDRFPAMLNSGEAVIPLDRLKGMLGLGMASASTNVSGEFRVRGNDLVAVLARENRSQNRRF